MLSHTGASGSPAARADPRPQTQCPEHRIEVLGEGSECSTIEAAEPASQSAGLTLRRPAPAWRVVLASSAPVGGSGRTSEPQLPVEPRPSGVPDGEL